MFFKHVFTALFLAAIVSSCSRPVAYFQPSARQNFKSTQTQSVAVVTPIEAVQADPVAPAEPQVVQVKQAVDQAEAYVRNDSKLASNKKLAKRMVRLNELLATTSNKTMVSTNAVPAKKMSFMERAMLKKINQKIKSHVAPDQAKAMDSHARLRLGIIIGIVGLLLLIIGNSAILTILGSIGLIVGLVLILLGVLNV